MSCLQENEQIRPAWKGVSRKDKENGKWIWRQGFKEEVMEDSSCLPASVASGRADTGCVCVCTNSDRPFDAWLISAFLLLLLMSQTLPSCSVVTPLFVHQSADEVLKVHQCRNSHIFLWVAAYQFFWFIKLCCSTGSSHLCVLPKPMLSWELCLISKALAAQLDTNKSFHQSRLSHTT